MKREIAAVSSALVAALLVAGCASTTSASSAAPAALAAKPESANITADEDKEDKKVGTAGGYRMVTRNGAEVYCKRQLVTGSRTNVTETCLTAAQMEAQKRGADDTMRRVNDMSNVPPGTNPAGEYNNPMTSSGRIN